MSIYTKIFFSIAIVAILCSSSIATYEMFTCGWECKVFFAISAGEILQLVILALVLLALVVLVSFSRFLFGAASYVAKIVGPVAQGHVK